MQTIAYFDVETTGLDVKKERIITIQLLPFEIGDGRIKYSMSRFKIFKAWDYSNRKIFLRDFLHYQKPSMFIGNNIFFDIMMLFNNLKREKVFIGKNFDEFLNGIFIIELSSFMIARNKWNIRGYGKFLKGEITGADMTYFYRNCMYDKIMEYAYKECEMTMEYLKQVVENANF